MITSSNLCLVLPEKKYKNENMGKMDSTMLVFCHPQLKTMQAHVNSQVANISSLFTDFQKDQRTQI
jgi:hypothetical protein